MSSKASLHSFHFRHRDAKVALVRDRKEQLTTRRSQSITMICSIVVKLQNTRQLETLSCGALFLFDHDTMVSMKINWRFVCVMIDRIRCFMSWWFMSTHVGSKYSNGRMRKMDEWHVIGARTLSYTNQRENVKCQRRLTLKSMPLEKHKSVSCLCVYTKCVTFWCTNHQ